MKIAVITGASSGMGKEFVLQLDRLEEYDELWLIARREDRLIELGTQTRAKVRPIALDLCQKQALDTYRDLLAEHKPEVAVLVNGSGFGRFGAFTDIDLEAQERMITLNASALMSMTYLTLPYMKKGGQIYQIDSQSAFQPVPYIGVYGATKAFVLSFSRSLNVELKQRGIRVMAICPGWVKTEFFDHAVTDNTVKYYARYYTSEQVVTRAIKDMKRGRDVSVCGHSIRRARFLAWLLPTKMVMKIWCNQQKLQG
ncbi:MAG: SDR family NAD(P)-dependent oxidoreductase [Ruminococcaceae bacterium]|nr:SDR family NAD(P)-dependent oxidoreductase [Oscillospiraceae bacterium]